MSIFIFLLVSALEWTALFLLILSMFLFPIKGYIPHIAFASIVLAQISYFLFKELQIAFVAQIIQLIVVFMFIWLMFRVHIFFSAAMAIMGYILYGLLQVIIIFIFKLVFINKEGIFENELASHLIQIATVIIIYGICWVIIRNRLGFSFVPDNERQKIEIKGQNKVFLVLMFVAAIIISFGYILTFAGFLQIILLIFLISAIFFLLMYIAIKKEREG